MSKSLHHGNPGNINLRGKATRGLGCRCCSIFNLRDILEDRRIEKEVRNASIESLEVEQKTYSDAVWKIYDELEDLEYSNGYQG